jgi:hypothetical protein
LRAAVPGISIAVPHVVAGLLVMVTVAAPVALRP